MDSAHKVNVSSLLDLKLDIVMLFTNYIWSVRLLFFQFACDCYYRAHAEQVASLGTTWASRRRRENYHKVKANMEESATEGLHFCYSILGSKTDCKSKTVKSSMI